jgi:hypothetical protein
MYHWTSLFNARLTHLLSRQDIHISLFYELLYSPLYSGKAVRSNTCRIRLTSWGDSRGFCRDLLNNSLFLVIYKPNSRRVPCVGRVWLAQAQHSKHHRQRDAFQLAKLDLAPRQSQSPRPLTACTIYPTLYGVGINSLVFQIQHPCLRPELPCSIHTPAN